MKSGKRSRSSPKTAISPIPASVKTYGWLVGLSLGRKWKLLRVARSSPYGDTHVKRLHEWIDDAASHGFAYSHGEREEGLSAVAAPVTGRSGTVVAALSLSGPTVRFGEDRVREFSKALRDAAQQISERGFSHPLT